MPGPNETKAKQRFGAYVCGKSIDLQMGVINTTVFRPVGVADFSITLIALLILPSILHDLQGLKRLNVGKPGTFSHGRCRLYLYLRVALSLFDFWRG